MAQTKELEMKTIWMQMRTKSGQGQAIDHLTEPKIVQVTEGDTWDTVQATIRHVFHIQAPPPIFQLPAGSAADPLKRGITPLALIPGGLVLKVRSHGSKALVIITGATPANDVSTPYVVEVSRLRHDRQPHFGRTQHPTFTQVTRDFVGRCGGRLAQLTNQLPTAKETQRKKMQRELEELRAKIIFISKRFEEAEIHPWQGAMVRRPFW